MTFAVEKSGLNVEGSIRKTPKLQQVRCRCAVAIELNSTASVVILRLGNDLERSIGSIGRDVDANHEARRREGLPRRHGHR